MWLLVVWSFGVVGIVDLIRGCVVGEVVMGIVVVVVGVGDSRGVMSAASVRGCEADGSIDPSSLVV